jgi:hypothetical protein
MPMSSNQLAALVARAREKAQPVVTPPPTPPVPRRKALKPVAPSPPKPAPDEPPTHPTPATPPPHHRPEAASPDDFPTGWKLEKDSWHFHRRFYAIFRRPMRCGEYSHLLWQIRRGTAEHLWEDCWRVRLPGANDRTLPVHATRWRLITILPKHWQPPARQESHPQAAE